MGQYENNCIELFLKTDNPPIPGKSPVFMFGRDYFNQANHWVEIWTVTDNYKMMEGTPKGADKIVHIGPDGHKGGPYPKKRRKADEMMFFYGTDPNHPSDLGAHVEFHLGEGKSEEVFEFDAPRCVFIPRGVRHGPIYITNFHRNLIIFDVLTAPTRAEAGTENDFSFVADEKTLA